MKEKMRKVVSDFCHCHSTMYKFSRTVFRTPQRLSDSTYTYYIICPNPQAGQHTSRNIDLSVYAVFELPVETHLFLLVRALGDSRQA